MKSAFDSTEIIINNNSALWIPANEAGEVSFVTDNLIQNGIKNVRTKAYVSGESFESQNSRHMLYEVFEAEDAYGTTFAGAINDFATDGMSTVFESGFSNIALHSAHPYPEADDMLAILKTPIIVASANATINYIDIAIIETGEDSTVFGDEEFWDYVIVEGSLDGVSWTPLADGYDASLHSDWLSAYDNEEDGTEALYKAQSIDLLETYEAGDVVQIRFRLFSDPNAVGWGWAIDDLYIQSEPLGEIENNFELGVYPNPMSTKATINFTIKETGIMSLMDIQGRTLRTIPLNPSDRSTTIDRGDLKPGALRTPIACWR